jgi:hypothetical protein
MNTKGIKWGKRNEGENIDVAEEKRSQNTQDLNSTYITNYIHD